MQKLRIFLLLTGFLALLPADFAFAGTQGPRSKAIIEMGDVDDGEEIWITCAPCHGDAGQGGGAGVYPRLAGLPARFLVDQILAFKRRDRVNIPMYPYTTERELPDEDIISVSAYIATQELTTEMPDPNVHMDGLERLKLAKAVLVIPRAPGDAEAAAPIYERDCGRCHGKDGYGHEDTVQLAGQHIPYLRKSFELIKKGERPHEHAEKLFGYMTDDDVQNMLAFLSTLDD